MDERENARLVRRDLLIPLGIAIPLLAPVLVVGFAQDWSGGAFVLAALIVELVAFAIYGKAFDRGFPPRAPR